MGPVLTTTAPKAQGGMMKIFAIAALVICTQTASAQAAPKTSDMDAYKAHISASLADCAFLAATDQITWETSMESKSGREKFVARALELRQKYMSKDGREAGARAKSAACASDAEGQSLTLAKKAATSVKSPKVKDAIVAAQGAFVAALRGTFQGTESDALFINRQHQLLDSLTSAIAKLDLEHAIQP
jgi:uncharacterized protein (AIM24 family)